MKMISFGYTEVLFRLYVRLWISGGSVEKFHVMGVWCVSNVFYLEGVL